MLLAPSPQPPHQNTRVDPAQKRAMGVYSGWNGNAGQAPTVNPKSCKLCGLQWFAPSSVVKSKHWLAVYDQKLAVSFVYAKRIPIVPFDCVLC